MIALAAKAVTIPNGRLTSSRYSVNVGPCLRPKIPRAGHRQEEQEQRQHRSEEVEKTPEVQPAPGALYEEPERDTPEAAPKERLVDIRRFQRGWRLDPERRADPRLKQDVAERDDGQCA